jgi:hypothetical protein
MIILPGLKLPSLSSSTEETEAVATVFTEENELYWKHTTRTRVNTAIQVCLHFPNIESALNANKCI